MNAHFGLVRSGAVADPVLEAALRRLPITQTLKGSIGGGKRVAPIRSNGQCSASRKQSRNAEANGGGAVGKGNLANREIIAVNIRIVRQDAVRYLLAFRNCLAVVLGHRGIVGAGNHKGHGRLVGASIAITDGVRNQIHKAIAIAQTSDVGGAIVRDVARAGIDLDDAA